MNYQHKAVISLTTLAMLGLTLTCDVHAEPGRYQARAYDYVQPCIAEIGKHVDYDAATRVIHWVARLDQKNLVEMEMRVNTSVYVNGSNTSAREYRTSCVIAGLGDVVEFRIDNAESESDAQG